MTAPSEQPPPADLPDVLDEGDRPSITEVNGTVARFEMAYSPEGEAERLAFGAPLLTRLPSYLFAACCAGVVGMVTLAYSGSSNSRLYVWIVEGDEDRPIPALVLAAVIALSGLATVVRSHMRGVVVTKHGLEARYLLPMGVPRLKRWAWAQIHRMVMDERGVMLELWDSTYERLPAVAEGARLAGVLAHAAGKHGIVTTQLAPLDKDKD